MIATKVLSGIWRAISSKSASAWAVDGAFRFLRFVLGEVRVLSATVESSTTSLVGFNIKTSFPISIEFFDSDTSLVGAAENKRENWLIEVTLRESP
jgi:hypothetical protein